MITVHYYSDCVLIQIHKEYENCYVYVKHNHFTCSIFYCVGNTKKRKKNAAAFDKERKKRKKMQSYFKNKYFYVKCASHGFTKQYGYI